MPTNKSFIYSLFICTIPIAHRGSVDICCARFGVRFLIRILSKGSGHRASHAWASTFLAN